jgi:hypothetical protein
VSDRSASCRATPDRANLEEAARYCARYASIPPVVGGDEITPGGPPEDRAKPWHLLLVVLLAVAVGGVIYWAVGGGGSTPAATVPVAKDNGPGSSASPSTTAGPSSDGYDFTRRQADTAAAKKINLTLQDVPTGWAAASSSNDSTDSEQFAKQLNTCLGTPNAFGDPDRVSVDSPTFTYAVASIQSSVEFAHTTAEARRDLSLFKSAKMSDCLKGALSAMVTAFAPGGQMSATDVQPLSVPPMADGSFALRMVFTISAQDGSKVPLYVDVIGFLADRAEVTGSFTNVAVPLPPQLEQKLMGVLLTRATGLSGSAGSA